MTSQVPGNFKLRDENAERTLNEIGKILRSLVEKSMPGWGFCFLMFKLGKGPGVFYTSNAERQSMIAAMRDFIAKYEAN